MRQVEFERILSGGESESAQEQWFQVTLCADGELSGEGRRCTLRPGAQGFVGGRHRGAAGLRLSFYEAVQTENCNRYRTPCADFAQISGDVGSVDKSRARIEVERRIVRDIEHHRGRHLEALMDEWFDTEPDTPMETLRLLVIELYHLIKWRLFDAYTLNAVRVKRGYEIYEILNIPDRAALQAWLRDWVRYTFSIIAPADDVALRRVAQAQRFMEENLVSNLKVRDVAQRLHMDAAYFSNLFKRETGLSPHRYLMGLKLDKALDMLRSGYPVGKTAAMLGFSDVKAFRTAFKARFGRTPSQVQPGRMINKVLTESAVDKRSVRN